MIAVLAIGDMLPTLRGRDLTGHGVRLPDATRGKVTLVSMGFSYESRFPVEAWTNRFRAEFGADRRVNYYEVATPEVARRLFLAGVAFVLVDDVARFLPVARELGIAPLGS